MFYLTATKKSYKSQIIEKDGSPCKTQCTVITMIKAIILDLDMTLINSIKRFYTVFNLTYRKFFKREIPWKIFFEYFKRGMLNDLIPDKEHLRDFWNAFKRGYLEAPIHPDDKLYPGAKETLAWLKERGYKIIVTTGREVPPEIIWKELEYFGISKYVDDVFTIALQDPDDEDILFMKTGMLKLILSKYNFKPHEVLFVGDYWVDMESCKRLGIIAIGVLTGYESREKLIKHGASFVINSIADLPSIVSKIIKTYKIRHNTHY